MRRRSVILGLLLTLQPAWAAAQQVSLTVLHTNDTHGHLLPFSYPSEVPAGSELASLAVRGNIGGIARRATLVKRLKAELEPKGTTVWLVDAGDVCDGTPFSIEYHGEADLDAMAAAGYTFGTIGNHEFNSTLAVMKKLLASARFPLLSANIRESSTGKLLVRASEIRRIDSLRIGVFGLTTREAGTYPASREGLVVGNEIETARQVTSMLRKEADIVMAVSHAGEKVDEQIAAEVPGINIIIGGHSHSRLPMGAFVWHSDDLAKSDVNGTIIVQAHQWGGEIGRLDLLFEKGERGAWSVSRYRARLMMVTPDIPEDPAVAAVVSRYWKPIAPRYGEVIGEAGSDFVERGSDLAPYNLVADAIRETFGTEIELENLGGVRAPLVKGPITRADLINMDPFNNTIVTFRITGRRLKEILVKARPAVSGLRYRIDAGTLTEVSVAGQEVDDDRIYTGAANSYFAGTSLQGIELSDTGRQRVDVITEYIRKIGTVHPVYDGRCIIVRR